MCQIFPSQLTYKRVHGPDAVRVEDETHNSDEIGHLVLFEECQSRKKETVCKQDKYGLDNEPDATFHNDSLFKLVKNIYGYVCIDTVRNPVFA